jgi:hypothetical protein
MISETAFLYFYVQLNLCENNSSCRVCVRNLLLWVRDFRIELSLVYCLNLMAKFAVLSKVGYIVKKLFFFEQLQVILLDGCCSEPNCKLAMDCRE